MSYTNYNMDIEKFHEYESRYADIQAEFDKYRCIKCEIIEKYGKTAYDEIMIDIHHRLSELFNEWINAE